MPTVITHFINKLSELQGSLQGGILVAAAIVFVVCILMAIFGATSQNRNRWILGAVIAAALAVVGFFAQDIISWFMA